MKASLLFSPSAGNRVILPASVVAREPTRQHQDSREEARTNDDTANANEQPKPLHGKHPRKVLDASQIRPSVELKPIDADRIMNNATSWQTMSEYESRSRESRTSVSNFQARKSQKPPHKTKLQSLAKETRIYGGVSDATFTKPKGKALNKLPAAPCSSDSKRSLLDPLKQLQQERMVNNRQETMLARALEGKIDRMGVNIPVAFLLERQHVAFAERVVLTAMCKVLMRHYSRVVRARFMWWKKRTITLRILEDHARQTLLTRQTSLAHACAIIQRKHHLRMRAFLLHWYHLMLEIRAAEQNHFSRVIQRCWRKCSLLVKFRLLAQEYRAYVRHVSAVKLQAAARRFLAVRSFQRLQRDHQRFVAVNRIHMCYRNYQICKIAQRQRQRDAALAIQRYWRGHRGRQRANRRRKLLRRVSEAMFLSVWRQTALETVRLKWRFAAKIQRCVRAFTFRCRVAHAISRNRRHRLYLPALQIQHAWHRYRQNRITGTVCAVVAKIVERHESAASRIQRRFRKHLQWKRDTSARLITKVFRVFTSRKIVMGKLLQWLHEWSAIYFCRWSGRCPTAVQRWRVPMKAIERGLRDVVHNQHHASKRLNVFAGLGFISSNKRFHQAFLVEHARKVQGNWRWHHFRSVVRKKMRAALLIHRSLARLFKSYKKRQQRKQVLGRWKRQRFVEMKAAFQQWKTFRTLIIEARCLKVTNESLRRVKWFRYQKVRKRMVKHWKLYIEYRHERAHKRQQAAELESVHIKRRVWRTWSKDRLPELTVRNRLSELKLVLHSWQQLKCNHLHEQKKKKAVEWRNLQLKSISFSGWKVDLQDMRKDMVKAERHDEHLTIKRSFSALLKYIRFMKQVDEVCRKMRRMRGIRQWVLRMCLHQQMSTWENECRRFCIRNSKKRCWVQWVRYIEHRRRQRAKLTAMQEWHKRKHASAAVAQWSGRVPILQDMHLISSIADEYHRVKLKQRIFRTGFFQFWTLTVGARRFAMATRIQRKFRSKRARQKLFVLRTKLTYQLETRVSMGLDVVDLTAETFIGSLLERQHVWVFALVTYPWQPVTSDCNEIFNKVATNWRFLRNERMKFGFANATDSVPSSYVVPDDEAQTGSWSDGECESQGTRKSTQFSLLSWLGMEPQCLPCIVAFWQGVTSSMCAGGAALDAPRSITRRFKKVCEEPSEPPLVFHLGDSSPSVSVLTLMDWINALERTSHEATATDLQSYMRGFLARRAAAKLREMKRERMALRIQNWLKMLRLKRQTRTANRAALKLQRWFHGIQTRRLCWRGFQASMTTYRKAAGVLRCAMKKYFSRKRFKAICRCLVATTMRFPNAPLCEECFDASAQKHTFTLATLKCRDCTQALCSACFMALHQSGKRMLHLADSIEVDTMNNPNEPMCELCEVALCQKYCSTCKTVKEGEVTSAAFCSSCFERAHSDPNAGGIKSGGTKRSQRLKSWWQSESFRSHRWSRNRPPESQHIPTASMIVDKYQWMTLNMHLLQLEEAQKAERSQKSREDELFALRMAHEVILRDAFDRYDSDHSGFIDKSELKRMFKEELCQPLKDNQIDEAMRAMDKSGDGKIQFDELLAWFAEGILDKSSNVSSTASDLLKETLKAKRKMRRYKEKMNEFLPPVPSIKDKLSILSPMEKVVATKVPGFPNVECLEPRDYAQKRRVFYRFLKEICQIEWIEEDESIIPIENSIEVFNNVFLPRWNAGELTYDFYFDDESFAFDGLEWNRRWDSQAKKYFFHTRRKRKKVQTHEGGESAGNTRRQSRRGTSGRRKSIRRASTTSQREDRHDARDAAVEEGAEEEDVIEVIDPRRKQMLWEDAKRAFTKADQDSSGYIDVKEFHHMLVTELCEPISKSKAKAIMNQIDVDGSGKIDFDEFFLWYATDKCQDYPSTPQMERVRAMLKTKRRARATAMAAVDASVTSGLKVKQAVEEKLKTQQLVRDSKGASRELIALLQEGFPKLLASKALSLHQQDVELARVWLTEKQREEQHENELVTREREERKAMRKRAAQETSAKRKQRIASVKKKMKLLFLGASKKEVHAATMQDALENLECEILLAEQRME